MDNRDSNAKVPNNNVEEYLSNLCNCQVFFPHEAKNELNEFGQMVHKCGIKSLWN